MIAVLFVLLIHIYPALAWHRVRLNKYVLDDYNFMLHHARWHKRIKKQQPVDDMSTGGTVWLLEKSISDEQLHISR